MHWGLFVVAFSLVCRYVSGIGAEAYVTALFSEDYLSPVKVLGMSLRETGTKRDMVVMVSPAISKGTREELSSFGWKLQEVEEMKIAYETRAKWRKNLTKLRLWQMTKYSKLIYLDADMLVLRNLDHLFACPGPICAVLDSPVPNKFNGGLLVLSPNETVFDALMEKWDEGVEYADVEQGLLNAFFPLESIQGNLLPFKYNAHAYAHKRSITHDLEDIYVVHYTTFKPWNWYTLPVGDTGLLWKQVERRLPDYRGAPLWVLLLLAVVPLASAYVTYVLSSKYCCSRAGCMLDIRKILVFSIACCAVGGLLAFWAIPTATPYLVGWLLVAEWGCAFFWISLIPFWVMLVNSARCCAVTVPMFCARFVKRWGGALCATKASVMHIVLLPLMLVFGGIQLVENTSRFDVISRSATLGTFLGMSVLLDVFMALVVFYMHSKKKESEVEVC
jgi:hypothetical protein